MKANRDPIISEALRRVGTLAKLAEACGITAQAVSLWTRVPAAQVINVERATRIPREKIRPDLYPPRRKRSASHAAA